MMLYIDSTRDDEKVELVIVDKSGKVLKRKFVDLLSPEGKPENLIEILSKFLSANKIKLSNLSKIAVRQGRGFFSRTRLGIVTTNALAFTFQIPIVPVLNKPNFKKILAKSGQGMVAPVYSKKLRNLSHDWLL